MQSSDILEGGKLSVQARTKLFEKGGADFAPGPYAVIFFTGPPPASIVDASPEKADERGGLSALFFPS